MRLKFPVGVIIVGFADDTTLEVYSELIEEVELIAAHSTAVVEEWMRSRKLELAHHKTEVVVVKNRKMKYQTIDPYSDKVAAERKSW